VAVWNLGRTIFKGWWQAVVAVAVGALYLAGANVLILLFGSGLVSALLSLAQRQRARPQLGAATPWPAAPAATGPAAIKAASAWLALAGGALAAVPFSQWLLFLTFLEIGAVIYGSGYVLLAFLRADLVTNLHWLSDRQLLDAISVGQFTPGPVFTTATFIGYVLGGWPGALVATLGIFLPSFVFVPLIHPVATRLRRSPLTAPLLDGVNIAAVALMAGVMAQLAQHALTDWLTWGMALGALAVLLRYKINSAWLILIGAGVGLAAGWLRCGPPELLC
jgi:chromate transporter